MPPPLPAGVASSAASHAGATSPPSSMDEVSAAWAMHAVHLSPTLEGSEYAPILAEATRLFQDALAACPLESEGCGLTSTAASCTLDLGSSLLPPQAVTMLIVAPSTLLPLLECVRCILHKRSTGALKRITVLLATTASRSEAAARLAPSRVTISGLGTALMSRLVTVTGTVVRLSTPKPLVAAIPFKCMNCGAVRSVTVEWSLEFPTRCVNAKCRSQSFLPVPEEATCVEAQTLRLQEGASAGGGGFAPDSGAGNGGGGGIAAMVDVLVMGALMERANVGDVVQVVGTLTARRVSRRAGGSLGQQLCILGRGVDLLSTGGGNGPNQGGRGEGHSPTEDSVMSRKQEDLFKSWAATSGWFNRLVASVAPAIYGHRLSKTAIVLALLGGTPREHVRSHIHLLLVGDPGVGKSQLLRSAASCCHRSAYVSANTASTCGLTLSVSRDASNDTTFEPGAVVHGDGGITCIDEIDKGTSEHRALLEVMEQQTLSIAKAGLIFTLPVATSILAAGNPVGGRYNPQRSLSENTNLSWPLLSRFDFILLLADDARSAGAETMLTDHVLRLHRGGVGSAKVHGDDESPGGVSSHRRPNDERWHGGASPGGDDAATLLSPSDVAAFVKYARATCKPELSLGARDLIRSWYLAAREARHTSELPVTVRLLQSVMRAAEARAKAELSATVTEAHASEAIDLLQRSRTNRVSAHTGAASGIPLSGPVKKSGKLSIRDQVVQRIAALLQEKKATVISHAEVVDICVDCGAPKPEALIQQLNSFGLLLQQSGNRYRLMGKPL